MTAANGGALVVRALQDAGIQTLFALHGAHIDSIFQAAIDGGLAIVDVRHEAAAGHAAEGYARAGAQLGVALVTAGGGFTNAVTSIANAWRDRTPVLFLTGSGPLAGDQTNTLQADIDQVAVAAPITKWAHRVTATDHIPRLIAQAVRIATSAPCGPVLLDLPWDVLTQEIDADGLAPTGSAASPKGAAGDPQALAEALAILAKGSRPVIVVGSEAARTASSEGLAELASRTGIPIFSDFEGLAVLRSLPDEVHGGLVQGLYGFERAGCAPDAVLMLGLRFGLNTCHGSGALLPHGAATIQVDSDGRELGRLQQVTLPILADPGAAIGQLNALAREREWPDRRDWQETVRARVSARQARVVAEAQAADGELHPATASRIVAEYANEQVCVVGDGALTYLWLSEFIAERRPHAFLTHGFLGSMGVGFGTAVGAQVALAASGKRVMLVTGDGAVGYSLAEFDTAVRHRIPIIVVVMNNRSWGATLHFQQMTAGPNRISGTRLENGRYGQVAAAFGAAWHEVHDEQGLRAALDDAFANPRPCCIDVKVALDPFPPEEMILIGGDPFAGGPADA